MEHRRRLKMTADVNANMKAELNRKNLNEADLEYLNRMSDYIAEKYISTRNERENLFKSIRQRARENDYRDLATNEIFYFMVKKNLSKLDNDNKVSVLKQIYKVAMYWTDSEDETEAFDELGKSAREYLKGICVIP